MRIAFGLCFDGPLPCKPETRLGFVRTGPSGLLSILETRLGLKRPPVSSLERLIQYHACLKSLDHEQRFYHKSFIVDPVAVSRELLGWRDQLYFSGWSGSIIPDASQRLKDMAEVEGAARKEVPPSVGERLQAVNVVLDSRETQITEISVFDAAEDLPELWRQVLSKLPVLWNHSGDLPPTSSKNTDLQVLKNQLHELNCAEDSVIPLKPLTGDGSVLVINSLSRGSSARLIAEYLNSCKPEKAPAVITGDHGPELNEILELVGLPRCGFNNQSSLRPPVQVLRLALSLLWAPIDPAVLLQFLTHPVSPLPARLRRQLAKEVAKSPGIGGKAWRAAIDDFITSEKEMNPNAPDKVSKLQADIDYWLGPDLFRFDHAVPTAFAGKRCKKVARWLGGRAIFEDSSAIGELFSSAQAQASELASALDQLVEQGIQEITRQQLDRLLDLAGGGGSPIPDKHAEAGHASASDSPASFFEGPDEVIWWDFSMPALPASPPWTQRELSELAQSGAHIQPVDLTLRHLARTWLRPVMAAGKRLILFHHKTDESHHPLWDQIQVCCSGWMELELESLVQAGNRFPQLDVKGDRLQHRPLPGFKRWWRLGDGRLLPARQKESFSSLDNFIKSPYQWVLDRIAALRTAGFEELVIDNRLKGTLVHRLFEEFFGTQNGWRKMGPEEITAWVKAAMSPLIEQEGALFLQPGKAMEREELTEQATHALTELVEHLKDANISEIEIEKHLSGSFRGGDLHGYIDMLLKDKKGREVVLDAKYSGLRYRIEALETNTHLQLALYSHLRKQNSDSGRWPEQAFFIIDSAHVISQSNTVLSNALVIRPDNNETVEDLWRRFETTWQWRRDQMNAGRIEVTVEGAEPDEDSELPEERMGMEMNNDRFNDYKTLTGWERDA